MVLNGRRARATSAHHRGHSPFSYTVLENLDDTNDLRARSVSAVTASISQKLALKVTLVLAYDNQPVVVDVQPAFPATQVAQFEYDKLDTILTATLVVNF